MILRYTLVPLLALFTTACPSADAADDPDGGLPTAPAAPAANVTQLSNKVEVGARDGLYRITVPSGQAFLQVMVRNERGLDLAVRLGQPPTLSDYLCRSNQAVTNDQVCTINNPAPGDYYISLYAALTSNVKMTALYEPNVPGIRITPLTSGVSLSQQAQFTGVKSYYSIFVPPPASGTQRLNVKITGSNGNADLHVGRGVSPVHGTFQILCTSAVANTSNENCDFAVPVLNDTYYIVVDNTAAYVGLSITATVGGGAPTTPTTPPSGGSGQCDKAGLTLITVGSEKICLSRQIPGYTVTGTYATEGGGATYRTQLNADGTGSTQNDEMWNAASPRTPAQEPTTQFTTWGVRVQMNGDPMKVQSTAAGEAHHLYHKAANRDWSVTTLTIVYADRRMIIAGQRIKR